jgi:hypothetical protein
MARRILLLCGWLGTPLPLAAQASSWADLWRIADGTLVQPGAVADAPAGAFWNPAALGGARRAGVALEAFQTPEVVNVQGVLVGASIGIGSQLGLGLLAGRMSVGDLIRTTSSPVSVEGAIPVYSQFLGAAAAAGAGPFWGGASLLVHDARLDQIDDQGVTVDLGVRFTPVAGLVLGGATHLGSALVTGGPATEYLLGAEYGGAIPPVLGLDSRLLGRYGLTIRESAASEHLGSVGLLLARRLLIDAGVIWAGGYGTGAWQPVLGVAFRAGSYRVGIARGQGSGGTGGSFRVTLAVEGSR